MTIEELIGFSVEDLENATDEQLLEWLADSIKIEPRIDPATRKSNKPKKPKKKKEPKKDTKDLVQEAMDVFEL